MQDNIYLTGFMGSGKSTVGQLLAKTWGWRFVDLDERIAQKTGLDITQAFATLGEEAFRKAETTQLKRAARRQRLMVACGGGLPVTKKNRALMEDSGQVVLLDASLKTCQKRLGPEQVAARPLWQDRAKVENLFQSRQDVYGHCHHRVAVDGLTLDETLAAVCQAVLPQKEMTASLDGLAHPLLPSWNAPQAVAAHCQGRRVVLLTDTNVERLHLARYQEVLDPALVLTIPAGEGSKTLERARRLYTALTEHQIDRGDVLVALGGGVVTDLGAFVAATYKRGMKLILSSTSLLGCVDASVGGKAAVNLGQHKNLVGCFVGPMAVVLDLMALSTLPRRHRIEGLVEAYKTGLVGNAALAHLTQNQGPAIIAGDLPAMARAAVDSVAAKARVVADDFRESGRRRILNFGHTYGHVLEGVSNYRLRHGLAVAAGMLVAGYLSHARGLLSSAEFQILEATLRPLTPTGITWPDADTAWALLRNDKKNRGGVVFFVLLESVGRAIWVDDVTPAELERAVTFAQGEQS